MKSTASARLQLKLRNILRSNHSDLKRSIAITIQGLHVQLLQRNKEKRNGANKNP